MKKSIKKSLIIGSICLASSAIVLGSVIPTVMNSSNNKSDSKSNNITNQQNWDYSLKNNNTTVNFNVQSSSNSSQQVPNMYTGKTTTSSGNTISYSSIILGNDDTITLNPSLTFQNSSITVSSYKWYDNGKLVTNNTNNDTSSNAILATNVSDSNESNSLEISGDNINTINVYDAVITYSEDGQTFSTQTGDIVLLNDSDITQTISGSGTNNKTSSYVSALVSSNTATIDITLPTSWTVENTEYSFYETDSTTSTTPQTTNSYSVSNISSTALTSYTGKVSFDYVSQGTSYQFEYTTLPYIMLNQQISIYDNGSLYENSNTNASLTQTQTLTLSNADDSQATLSNITWLSGNEASQLSAIQGQTSSTFDLNLNYFNSYNNASSTNPYMLFVQATGTYTFDKVNFNFQTSTDGFSDLGASLTPSI